MTGQVVKPNVERRQCLVWTGALCAIAYALFAINAGLTLIKFDFKSYDEFKSYYDFIQLLYLTGNVCFIGGIVSLLVFKPHRITPYLGLAGGFMCLLHNLAVYCEADFIIEFARENQMHWLALMSAFTALTLTPVHLLKDRVAGAVGCIGMIGFATIAEMLVVRLIVYAQNDYSPLYRNVFPWFELIGQIALFVFYATLLACWNRKSEAAAVPCKQPLKDRLAALQELKDENLVTEEEYQSGRKNILSEL